MTPSLEMSEPHRWLAQHATATDEIIPQRFGMLLPRERKKSAKWTQPNVKSTPSSREGKGAKFGGKKYIFIHS